MKDKNQKRNSIFSKFHNGKDQQNRSMLEQEKASAVSGGVGVSPRKSRLRRKEESSGELKMETSPTRTSFSNSDSHNKNIIDSSSSKRGEKAVPPYSLPTSNSGRLRTLSRGEIDGGDCSLRPNARRASSPPPPKVIRPPSLPQEAPPPTLSSQQPPSAVEEDDPPPISLPLVRQTSLSQGQSVSKHYALSNQILSAFDSLYQQKEFRGAYAFGIRYAEVALIEIPKHGYFYSKRHENERILNSKNALRVTQQIKHILTFLDSKPEASERELIDKLHKLAEEQVVCDEQELYERGRLEVESDLARQDTVTLCGDILDYVEMICPSGEMTSTGDRRTSLSTSSSDMTLMNSSHNNQRTASGITKPQVVQRSRTSYESQRSMNSENLQRALALSGSMVPGSSSSENPLHPGRKRRSHSELSIRVLYMCYHDDFKGQMNRGQLRVSQANTYQGRDPGSTNGCSLIAPLLCYYHFHNWDENTTVDQGLNDGVIGEVIDAVTPSLLPEVRSNLGLYRNALIIPVDVHTFLMEKELLTSEQFVTVCGGDILDDKHLTAFVEELQHLNEVAGSKYHGRKLAATFFFHEHVVAILKLQRSKNEFWYDVIDSLPNQTTLKRELDDVHDAYFVPNTSRTRCMNVESLKAALKWHACSRFTDENMSYIDMYDWDESYSDFDPRVFQAFIWAG